MILFRKKHKNIKVVSIFNDAEKLVEYSTFRIEDVIDSIAEIISLFTNKEYVRVSGTNVIKCENDYFDFGIAARNVYSFYSEVFCVDGKSVDDKNFYYAVRPDFILRKYYFLVPFINELIQFRMENNLNDPENIHLEDINRIKKQFIFSKMSEIELMRTIKDEKQIENNKKLKKGN